MSSKDLLESVKKLREATGVGFKDCKLAIDESKGDLEKAIEFLRKKGIAKASNKMNRIAAEGLCLLQEKNGKVSLIEINSETDFVAKNESFISFCKEVSMINFINKHWKGFKGFDVYGEANLNFINKNGQLLPTRIISQMEIES